MVGAKGVKLCCADAMHALLPAVRIALVEEHTKSHTDLTLHGSMMACSEARTAYARVTSTVVVTVLTDDVGDASSRFHNHILVARD